jgi:hypothetical protein
VRLTVVYNSDEEGEIAVLKSQLHLSAEEIGRIVTFLGYGSTSAPVWFVGFEEGLGDMTSADTVRNLTARGSFEKTMDLRDAHLRLHENGIPIDIAIKAPSTQVWQYMAKIMLAYNGNKYLPESSKPDKEARKAAKEWRRSVKEYVCFHLGRSEGQSFLTELSPIPAGKIADKKWMKLFRQLDVKVDDKIGRRKEELKRTLRLRDPALVVCYGERADDFAELLGVEWHEMCPGVRASRDSRRLLLPFFGNGQMSHSVIKHLLDFGLLGPSRATL